MLSSRHAHSHDKDMTLQAGGHFTAVALSALIWTLLCHAELCEC